VGLVPESCKYIVNYGVWTGREDPKSESEFGLEIRICEMNLLNRLVPKYVYKKNMETQ
jgi:hypothetical protein